MAPSSDDPRDHVPARTAGVGARLRSGLGTRVLLSVVLLVALLQAATYLLVTGANLDNARGYVQQELADGEAELLRALEDRRRRLRDDAALLAALPGLREAAAVSDGAALTALLQPHLQHTSATNFQVVDALGARLAGGVAAPAGAADPARRSGLVLPADPAVLRRAAAAGPVSVQAVADGRVFELAVLALSEPSGRPASAYLLLAHEYDRALASLLRERHGLELGFALARGGSAQPLDGTLSAAALRSLAQAGTLHNGRSAALLAAEGGREIAYRAVVAAEAGDLRVLALLQRPLAEVLPVFERLRALLGLLMLASVGAAALAGLLIARGVARPLAALAASAERLGDGDYRVPIAAGSDDQVGTLAGSLDRMRVALAEREQRILQLAYEDPLAGLPNRARLIEQLAAALRDAQRSGQRLAVMMLDLDRFKQVNDTLGHAAGDEVLRRVGGLLRGAVRPADIAARLGGDEFAVLLPGADAEAARAVARSIVGALKRPLEIDGQAVDVGAAIGVALFPDHGADGDTLLRCADIAMYAAKRNHAALAVYDPSYEVVRREHLSLLGELRRAVAESHLRAYYQPKVDLGTGRAAGAEVLVRWKHPERGLLSPAAFMPYAEQTGFVRSITRWMLAVSLRQCGAWAAAGAPLSVAVNVSAADLMSNDLVKIVDDLLRQHAVPPALVCLEITEGSFMQDPDHALQVLKELHALGVRLAIDDFGTGFSSLAYLKRLPVDELKIDQTFVRGMADSGLDGEKDASIVRSTIQLAHNLGLKVVAEGVEDKDCVRRLQQMGCDLAQGYYFGRPMRRSQLEAWVQRRADGRQRRLVQAQLPAAAEASAAAAVVDAVQGD